jgi:Transposase DDE domain
MGAVRDRVSISLTDYLLSVALSPERLGQVARSHWGVENRLHWVLNAVLHEDRTRNRNDNSAYNLAILRQMALTLCNGIARGCRCAANSTSPLGRTGSGPGCCRQFEKWHKGKM